MKSSIRFAVDGIPFKLKDQKSHKEWLQHIAAAHGQTIGTLQYVFVSDDALLAMNQQYLSHDTYTDIITFPMEGESGVSGEIYISVDRVQENAATFGQVFEIELKRVMAHGLLHLLGFKDKTKAQEKAMRSAEDAAIGLWG